MLLKYDQKRHENAVMSLDSIYSHSCWTKESLRAELKAKSTHCIVLETDNLIYGFIIFTFHIDSLEINKLVGTGEIEIELLLNFALNQLHENHKVIVTEPFDIRDITILNIFKKKKFIPKSIQRGDYVQFCKVLS